MEKETIIGTCTIVAVMKGGRQGDDCNVDLGMNSRFLFMSIIQTFRSF